MTNFWEPNYVPPALDTNLISNIENQVTGAVQTAETAAAQVATQAGVPQVVVQPVEDAVQAATAVANRAITPAVTAAVGAGTPIGGITTVIEAAASDAIKAAQGQIVGRVQTAITSALSGLGAPEVASIPSGDLKKIDAWERAGRTFLTGIFVTILAGLVQVVGQALTDGSVNFFTKDGWTAVATLAVGSVITSACSYILRYIKEPAGAAINSSTPKT